MVKAKLEGMHGALRELEDAARKLQNQNFADIVKAASSRVHQLLQHPDLDAVHEHLSGEVEKVPGLFPGMEVEHEGKAHRSDGSTAEDHSAQTLPGESHVVQGGTPFPS